jgi:hypothetical protein
MTVNEITSEFFERHKPRRFSIAICNEHNVNTKERYFEVTIRILDENMNQSWVIKDPSKESALKKVINLVDKNFGLSILFDVSFDEV